MKLGAILAAECIVGEMENEEFFILIMHPYEGSENLPMTLRPVLWDGKEWSHLRCFDDWQKDRYRYHGVRDRW